MTEDDVLVTEPAAKSGMAFPLGITTLTYTGVNHSLCVDTTSRFPSFRSHLQSSAGGKNHLILSDKFKQFVHILDNFACGADHNNHNKIT